VAAYLLEGEPISERRVVMVGDKGLMSGLLTPGMRAVATEISTESASGGFIQPGDHVDIILTVEVEEAPLAALPCLRNAQHASQSQCTAKVNNPLSRLWGIKMNRLISNLPSLRGALIITTAMVCAFSANAGTRSYSHISSNAQAEISIRTPGQSAVSRSVVLPFSKSTVVELPVGMKDVIISNPDTRAASKCAGTGRQ